MHRRRASLGSSAARRQISSRRNPRPTAGFATPERRLLFDINDLDETLPAPWEWDVKRLVASFVLALVEVVARVVAFHLVSLAAGGIAPVPLRLSAAEIGKLDRLPRPEAFASRADFPAPSRNSRRAICPTRCTRR